MLASATGKVDIVFWLRRQKIGWRPATGCGILLA